MEENAGGHVCGRALAASASSASSLPLGSRLFLCAQLPCQRADRHRNPKDGTPPPQPAARLWALLGLCLRHITGTTSSPLPTAGALLVGRHSGQQERGKLLKGRVCLGQADMASPACPGRTAAPPRPAWGGGHVEAAQEKKLSWGGESFTCTTGL